MSTFQQINTARQIKQLERYEPHTAAKSAKLLARFPGHAQRLAADGLARVMDVINKPADNWTLIEQAVQTGYIGDQCLSPAQSGRVIKLQTDLRLFCDPSGQWRLRAGLNTSAPLIHWGRDDNNISSAQAGRWKLTQNARRHYKNLVGATK